jgi:hypothetical protein
MEPTARQRELLRWMVASEREEDVNSPSQRGWTGGDLIPYYHERKVREGRARGLPESILSHTRGGYANHGWRRAGGTVLKHLAETPWLTGAGFTDHGIPLYQLTEEGRRIGNET